MNGADQKELCQRGKEGPLKKIVDFWRLPQRTPVDQGERGQCVVGAQLRSALCALNNV